MLKRGIAFGFWLAFFAGFAAGARVYAGKPADLPAHNQIECPDCGDDAKPRKFSLELDVTPKGVNLQFGFSDAQPGVIDPFLPAFVEYWLQHAADALTQPQRSVNLENLLSSLPYLRALRVPAATTQETPMPAPPAIVKGEKKPAIDVEKQLRQLFESADQYRRTGLYESARYLYQRVHLLSPTSRLGQMAIEQLQEIERRLRETGEEQDPNRNDEPDVRNGAIPLGLVRLRY